MEFGWNDTKRIGNLAKHGVEFSDINAFEWDTAFSREDVRSNYGEIRYVSVGRIRGRVHVAVWTTRDGKGRLISLRRANKREVERYEQT